MCAKELTLIRNSIFAALAIASIAFSQTADKFQEAERLVSQLPTNNSSRSAPELEKQIAELGAAALPALKKELRMGIRNKEREANWQNSRRPKVVSVLAQINTPESTEMLVQCLSDPIDTAGMLVATLKGLENRELSSAQTIAMLNSHLPDIVLAGIEHARDKLTDDDIKARLIRVFDRQNAEAQFVNEYGKSTASADGLWNVRFAAGSALKIDLTSEIQSRTKQVLEELKNESLHPTSPEAAEWISDGSRSENIIRGDFNRLVAMGKPAKDLVETEATAADGIYAQLLDMARVRFGDKSRIAAVAKLMTSSDNHTVRFCAAHTLRVAADRSTIDAFHTALRDPYQRFSGSDVGAPHKEYPTRLIAADALIDLGADPKEIRAAIRE